MGTSSRRAPRQVYDPTIVAETIDAQSAARISEPEESSALNHNNNNADIWADEAGGWSQQPSSNRAGHVLDGSRSSTTSAEGKVDALSPPDTFHGNSSGVCDIPLEDDERVNTDDRFSEIDRSKFSQDDNAFRTPKYCRILLILLGAAVFIMTLVMVIVKNKQAKSALTAPTASASSQMVVLPPPPAALTTTCARSDISTSQVMYQACEQLCQPADCCNYPATMDLSCLAGNEQTCLTYHQDCGNLLAPAVSSSISAGNNSSGTTIPPAPSNLETICSATSVTTANGLSACSKYCMQAYCCWQTGVVPCTNNTVCAAYSPCLHLRAIEALSSNVTNHVSQVCSNASLATLSGRTSCVSACQTGQCCFQLTHSGSGSGGGMHQNNCPLPSMNETFCAQFEACQALYGVSLNIPHLPSPSPTPPQSQVPTVTNTIASQPTTTMTPTAAASATASPTPFPTIISTASDTTMSPAPTPNPNEFPGPPPMPSNIATICNVSATSTELAECRHYCESTTCCQISQGLNNSCSSSHHKECHHIHLHCKILKQLG